MTTGRSRRPPASLPQRDRASAAVSVHPRGPEAPRRSGHTGMAATSDNKMEVQTLLESQQVKDGHAREPGVLGWLAAPVVLNRGCMLLAALVVLVVVAVSGGGGDAALSALGEALGGSGGGAEPAFGFDDIFDGSLRPRYASVQWIGGERMAALRDGGLELASPRLGQAEPSWEPLVSAERFAAMNSSSWEVSHSGDFVLFASNAHSLYRHSFYAQYQILDVATESATPVDARQVQQAAAWCQTATGGVVAYVMGYNIYLLDAESGAAGTSFLHFWRRHFVLKTEEGLPRQALDKHREKKG
jgi:hypothetical protein